MDANHIALRHDQDLPFLKYLVREIFDADFVSRGYRVGESSKKYQKKI